MGGEEAGKSGFGSVVASCFSLLQAGGKHAAKHKTRFEIACVLLGGKDKYSLRFERGRWREHGQELCIRCS